MDKKRQLSLPESADVPDTDQDAKKQKMDAEVKDAAGSPKLPPLKFSPVLSKQGTRTLKVIPPKEPQNVKPIASDPPVPPKVEPITLKLSTGLKQQATTTLPPVSVISENTTTTETNYDEKFPAIKEEPMDSATSIQPQPLVQATPKPVQISEPPSSIAPIKNGVENASSQIIGDPTLQKIQASPPAPKDSNQQPPITELQPATLPSPSKLSKAELAKPTTDTTQPPNAIPVVEETKADKEKLLAIENILKTMRFGSDHKEILGMIKDATKTRKSDVLVVNDSRLAKETDASEVFLGISTWSLWKAMWFTQELKVELLIPIAPST